jgi:hypothetical protein
MILSPLLTLRCFMSNESKYVDSWIGGNRNTLATKCCFYFQSSELFCKAGHVKLSIRKLFQTSTDSPRGLELLLPKIVWFRTF